MTNDLSAAVFKFIQSLDLCFEDDFGHTESLPIESIREALLGKEISKPSHHCNLDNLATASEDLRRELIYSINNQIRHGNKSISVQHF